ncbi:hypothetical protein J2X20_005538 [Pelomonas saccharophila]|uniref:Uncharacterized protein n=1 Tax=Roseateles saccharophilus TaxID=304 RepID=A0ABU1YVG5_ROSSA|nr:hypothetical protein [Roseateles saccharophilus]MDR7272853.1 hypothetical protein [Roseateles saccharophilus]
MHPHTSSVRTVLQWINEFKRIDIAREIQLDGSTKNYVMEFGPIADKLRDVKTDSVGTALGKVEEIDKQRCGERLADDKTLEKWTQFLEAKKAFKGHKAFDEAAGLVEQARLAKDPREAQKHLASARQKLWDNTPDKLEKTDIPGVPSGQSARKIDPAQAVKALKRKDLESLIARNDTWGNFDPAKALGDKATEEDLKVLLNIIESAVEADQQDAAWKEYEDKVNQVIAKRPGAPVDAKVYKEVILGAGASAAYYIASNYGKFDMKNTMILGNLQPWAKDRGKDGNVNHPHNQTDPQQKGNKPIEDDEKGLAARAELSRRIAEVIAKVPHTQCTIEKVRRCQGDFFEIETKEEGSFYASKVTNAMGIGKQKEPDLDPPAGPETKAHMHDMDSFKQKLDDGTAIKKAYPKVKSVCVSGGNAAIDVITAIIRDQGKNPSDDKLDIHWVVGDTGAPAFLNGTDNALAAEAFPDGNLVGGGPLIKNNMKVYRGRLTGASGAGPVQVIATYSDPPRSKTMKTHKFTVDMVVYGTGPDSEAMQRMFVNESSVGKDEPLTLEPVIDKSRHYNVQIEEKNPVELMKKLQGKLKDEQAATELKGFLEDPSLEKVVDNLRDVIVSVKSQDSEGAKSTMQFVGASGARMQTNNGSLTPLSPRDPDVRHEAIASLPENVVGNDQLTAARSRIEAQFNSLPTSSDDDVPLVAVEGGINFITSNQTVIRVHIAECYPKIPPGLGDYVTGQIIFERSQRTEKGKTPKASVPIPTPTEGDTWMENLSLKQQKDFQNRWTKRLQDISARIS